jgi:NADPH-dependent 2,4-dienoyl-CoA reductase/sulfur reductase-like enzyme
MTENTDVVVIGGGYAGVLAANRLTQRDDVTVTLINPRPTFVERIRLHQLVGGSYDDYRKILADGVRLVVDTVTRINASERSVTLATGGTVGYDYLIYAAGSRSAKTPPLYVHRPDQRRRVSPPWSAPTPSSAPELRSTRSTGPGLPPSRSSCSKPPTLSACWHPPTRRTRSGLHATFTHSYR